MEYGVVFSGKILAGHSPEQVRDNFARLFPRADPARLQRLFSGQEIILKQGLSAGAAETYRQALQRAGAACEIRRTGNRSADGTAIGHGVARPVAPPAPPATFTLLPVEKAEPPDTAAAMPAHTAAEGPVSAPDEGGSSAITRAAVIKGSGAGYGSLSIMPDAARGFCWGGFFMPWIWGTFNGVQISFLAIPGLRLFSRFLPPWLLLSLSMLMSVFMLVKGRELAWQNRNWDSAEHFNRVQKRWTMAGLTFALALAVLLPHWLSHAAP